MISRRRFLQLGAVVAGAGLVAQSNLPPKLGEEVVSAGPAAEGFAVPPAAGQRLFVESQRLKKFIQPLRMPGKDIPIAEKDKTDPGWWQKGVDHYTIDIGQFTDQLHPNLPNPTRLWGFGQNGNFKHLGGIIAAKRGTPVQITFRNKLPKDHILPVDNTIMGVAGNQNNRTCIHLHGGYVPWTSDGGPHAWWDPDGHKGLSFVNNQVLRPGQTVPNNEAEYYYPNQAHTGRLLWYHDHAFGLTRLNAYAGIATAYVLYDDYELSLGTANNVPGPLDPRTVYLVFQDKVFVPYNVDGVDPKWRTLVKGTRPGDLWYANEYETKRWDQGPTTKSKLPRPSVVPEFFGDTMLVNGTAFPYLEVEQREYRFRMLNACQARFLNPRLMYAKGITGADSTEPTNQIGPAFIQFGTEGGFLPHPVMLNGPSQGRLIMAPAERADLIVDFRNVPPGSILILYSDAPAPFPSGDDGYDFYAGNHDSPNVMPGYGPNTRTLMQIRVKARVGAFDKIVTLPDTMEPMDKFLVTHALGVPTTAPAGVKTRFLTLNEDFDEYGRLIQYLGTSDPVNQNPLSFGREYLADPTEVIPAGTTEVWEILNMTGDTHPIHFHLADAQVLSRQPFDQENYRGGKPDYEGPAYAPDPNELGFKETVRMNPEEATRVILNFTLPVVPFTVPVSPRTGGHEYVWHCHILEHEEHDMMRPLIIQDVKK
jgi:spore coat protein A, manganese oxidase